MSCLLVGDVETSVNRHADVASELGNMAGEQVIGSRHVHGLSALDDHNRDAELGTRARARIQQLPITWLARQAPRSSP